jgi:phosphatidate cytidylyltransferase
MLLPRLLTAIIGLPILIAAIYFGSLPFFFLVLGIVFLGLREFYYLAEECGYPTFRWLGTLGGLLVVLSVFLAGTSFGQVTENQFTAALLSILMVVIVVRSIGRGPTETLLSEWGVTFFGILYVAWSLAHLLLIRELRPHGQMAAFLLFVLIWAQDIIAYLVGTRWGRHLIAEKISPKKTWEGTIAGLLASVLVALIFQSTVLRQDLRLIEAIVLGVVLGILAFLSDLSESLLKRSAGMKDSSPLLPGHGGILDRFDSFILTAPFYYYYWAFLKH